MAELKRRVAVLISGRGSNLGALIAAARQPDYPAELALVLSNKADAGGLARAQEAGIPTAVVESRPFGRDRAAFEAVLQARLDQAGIGLIALAGFMRVLTEGFVSAWAGRMLNIHPSLLPAFPGLDTHARALAAGVRLHGCTVHFVTPGVDEGPIIAQAAVPVLAGDDESALAARVLAQEHRIYPAALAWAASGAARLVGDRVVLTAPMAQGALANPLPGAPGLPTETA
jgi:phosphoribosylglycinamide formyltransferase-1